MQTFKTFKIQRTNESPLVVHGEMLSSATGNRYYVQVVRTSAGGYVLVIGDYRDDWQTAHEPAGLTGLLYTLRSFDTEPLPLTAQAHLRGQPDLAARQDLLETVDVVLREVGGHAERPQP